MRLHLVPTAASLSETGDLDADAAMEVDEPLTPRPTSSPGSEGPEHEPNDGRCTTHKPAVAVPHPESDSDLTDLSDTPDEPDTDSSLSSCEESDTPPPPKRAKPNKKALSAEKKKPQLKGKGNKARRNEEDDEEWEEKKLPKVKKAVVAKEAFWQDMPDWGDRTDCPLLDRLPAEVLDRCFGIWKGLELRDWVSLAGVSRFFRHNLDDAFFRDACRFNAFDYLGRRRMDATDRDGLYPFTRSRSEWRQDPPAPAIGPVPNHYTPRGSRDRWTYEQYVVYKEEQAVWREKEIQRQKELAGAMRRRSESVVGRIHVFLRNQRKILAVIKGRKDGESPVRVNDKGLPVADKKEEEVVIVRTEPGEDGLSVLGRNLWTSKVKPVLPRPREDEEWTAPETDEDDDGIPPPEKTYDDMGYEVKHDHWYSEWRTEAAKRVKESNINKFAAMREYKITEGELITLKHYLVPNHANSKQPLHIFSRAAVQALAIRSHGGVVGHKTHLEAIKKRSAQIAIARQARIAKEKAAGTFVENNKCAVYPEHFLYGQYRRCRVCAREHWGWHGW